MYICIEYFLLTKILGHVSIYDSCIYVYAILVESGVALCHRERPVILLFSLSFFFKKKGELCECFK